MRMYLIQCYNNEVLNYVFHFPFFHSDISIPQYVFYMLQFAAWDVGPGPTPVALGMDIV